MSLGNESRSWRRSPEDHAQQVYKANQLNGSGPNKGVGEGPDKKGKLTKCGYAPNCFSSDAPGEGPPRRSLSPQPSTLTPEL